jgi:hypothetical protein
MQISTKINIIEIGLAGLSWESVLGVPALMKTQEIYT